MKKLVGRRETEGITVYDADRGACASYSVFIGLAGDAIERNGVKLG